MPEPLPPELNIIAAETLELLAKLRGHITQPGPLGRIARVLYAPTPAETQCAARIVAALAELERSTAPEIGTRQPEPDSFVHYLLNDHGTVTPCGRKRDIEAGVGPSWSDRWRDVNCPGCLAHAPQRSYIDRARADR